MKSIPLRHVFTQATYFVVLFSAIFLCLGSFVLMAVISRQNLHANLLELAERKSESVERILTSASETVRNIAYDEGLQQLLSRYVSEDEEEELLNKIKVNRELQNQSRFFSQADNIIAYSPDGVILGNKYGVDSVISDHIPQLLQMAKDSGNILWILPSEDFADHGSMDCIMLTEIRASSTGNGVKLNDILGYLVVQYNFGELELALETEQSGYNAHLISMDGSVICTTGPADLPETVNHSSHISLGKVTRVTYRGAWYYVAAQRISLPSVSFYCICTAPVIKILEDVYVALVVILLMSAMIMLCTYFVIRRRSERICRTFGQMNRSFELIEEGELDLDTFSQTGVLEVDDLTERFKHMANQLDQVMYELYESELHKQSLIADRKEAELTAVRMQINPHFLYNTLDTINWTALTHGDYEVSEMVLMMARLLRSNLSLSSVNPTVRLELERVELFVQLEQKRFGEQLRYEAWADECLLDAAMPGMMLQILVENAINHGFDRRAGQGLIRVRVEQDGEQIVATVSDDGKGMPPEVAAELRQAWENAQEDTIHAMQPSSHIGLRNIMKRLRLLYGTHGGFSFETGQEGTTIRISYPKQSS